jgi:hypothetical protein
MEDYFDDIIRRIPKSKYLARVGKVYKEITIE